MSKVRSWAPPFALRVSRLGPPSVKRAARRPPWMSRLADDIYARHGRGVFPIGLGDLGVEIDVRNKVERGLAMSEHEPYLTTWLLRRSEKILRECGYRMRELGRVPSCVHVVAEPMCHGA